MSTTKISTMEGSSFAPAAPWGEHSRDSHGHVVQFYSEDKSLIETLGRFIGSALEAGDAAIVVATKTHRDGLAQQLESRGLNVASAIEEGRYVPLDAAETMAAIMVDGWPDESRFANHIGGPQRLWLRSWWTAGRTNRDSLTTLVGSSREPDPRLRMLSNLALR